MGDWVAVATSPEGVHTVTAVFPRRSRFLRAESGTRAAAQMLAANVDQILIVAPLGSLNVNRLERMMVGICGGGAEPAVVISKTDLDTPKSLAETIAAARTLMENLEVHSVSTRTTSGSDVRQSFSDKLVPGTTYALVGTSGAGKSTLLNTLMGEEKQETGDVREGDGKGRHTTSFRELFALPNGALVMDTPGIREFALWSESGGLEQVFSEIYELASACRFQNCKHQSEPGCEVRGALESGELSARRFGNWRLLREELEANEARRNLSGSRDEKGKGRRKGR